jgi:glycosyltransferase involved in cell wall biosynthesis/SAM-dependent methyltransferase
MRFGIDFRLLSAGPAVVRRGMGRFTQQQLREVLRLDAARRHEFVLLLAAGHDPDLLLPEIAGAANVSRVNLPASLGAASERNAPRDLLRHAAELSRLIADLRLDVFHATTPFLAADPAFWRCDSAALVATHYDLIPLVYRDHYYRGAELENYLRTTRALRFADRLLAISGFVRDEAALRLGIDRGRIDVAHPVAEPWFKPLAAADTAALLADLRLRCPLPGEFLLTVTHLHHSKNLLNLLRGYAVRPVEWRRRHPLVVAGDFDPAGRRSLAGGLRDLGIQDQVVLPGLVADHELAALYNACHLFVMPSRYEGFGLPALEAMSCGAAVVAADAAALPEVVGEAGLLVDPEEPASFAAAFERLAGDPALRQRLCAAALERAARFGARQLGEATLECYERAAGEAREARTLTRRSAGNGESASRPAGIAGNGECADSRPERLRLALWSPLPPLPSGISDYTAELLGALGAGGADADGAEIEIFVDDGYLPDQELTAAWPIFHYSAFERRQQWRRFDMVIYQMGASMYHLYMYEAVRRWPGLLVLHDLTLGYVRFELFAAGWPQEEIQRELLDAEGLDAQEGYEDLRRLAPGERTRPTEEFLNRHYMLRQMIAASRAEIVHLPRAGEELAARYPRSRVFTFPMGVEDPQVSDLAGGPAAMRRRYGLPAGVFVVAAFGIADPVKRIEAAIEALARIGAEAPGALLLIVGRFSRTDYRTRLRELAGRLGLGERVRLFEQVAKGDFYRLLMACDAVVNLRFPFRKQMSATLMRALAAGKPVAISDVPDWDHLPAAFCYRVEPNEDEGAQLAAWLAGLARDPGRTAAIGAAAREYYLRHGTVARMADHYRTVIEDLAAPAGTDPAAGRALEAAPHPQQMPQATREPHPEPSAGAVAALRHDKVCTLEDFRDPELAELIRQIFPHQAAIRGASFPVGAEDRKHWEIAMSVRALRRHGALRPDATLLGVGAGSELTSFYLTRHAARVIATDLYLDPAGWSEASALMLTRPQELCPYPYESAKLTVQHMDGRVLDFPDDTFAGIFSAGAIEHFGSLADIAAAAYEMGRVLAPGGIASLSTEYLLAGPPGPGDAPGEYVAGATGMLLFTAERLRRYIVEASGLEPVDEMETEVSAATLATARELLDAGRQIHHGERKLPHLVLSHQGRVFGSVHLALRKTARYPAADNSWARPSAALRQEVARAATAAGVRLSGRLSGEPPPTPGAAAAPAPVAPASLAPAPSGASGAPTADGAAIPTGGGAATPATGARAAGREAAFARWDEVHGRAALRAPASGLAPARAWGFLRRTARRIRDLGVAGDRERALLRVILDEMTADDRTARLDAALAALARVEGEVARLGDLNAERQDLHGLLHDISTRQNTLTARLANLAVRQNLSEESLRGHSHSLLTVEQMLPRQEPAQDNGAGGGPAAEHVARLLTALERELPALARGGAIEVSAGGPHGGELRSAAEAHFGARLAAHGPAGGFPHDAWLHIDLSPEGGYPILLDNAASRLARGGLFLLVTAAGRRPEARHPALRPAGEHDLTALLGVPAQALIWERV